MGILNRDLLKSAPKLNLKILAPFKVSLTFLGSGNRLGGDSTSSASAATPSASAATTRSTLAEGLMRSEILAPDFHHELINCIEVYFSDILAEMLVFHIAYSKT